jgi:hypothetical protein
MLNLLSSVDGSRAYAQRVYLNPRTHALPALRAYFNGTRTPAP